jgi:hypothetical protein
MSNQTGSGYGYDHPNPEFAEEYRDVFTKYYMPYLNPELSSWSDRQAPYVEFYSTEWLMFNVVEEVVTEGFTIDFENQLITFNEPRFLYQTDDRGEISAIRAPTVKIFLFKKNYYTYTINPSDDPTEDVSNPLMFFTDKMGSYSDTIMKDLNLSGLSIQIGRGMITTAKDYVPSWDDTNFAHDVANWELSKLCDKKIRGTIEITLDAMCFYNIDLTNRIYIAGITDEPMNITSISYNIGSFTVSLQLENSRYYSRSISYQSHGE